MTTPAPSLTWARVGAPWRTLARWATIVNAAGYLVAIATVRLTTRLTPAGAAARYRGVDPALASPDAPMQFPKPPLEMLVSTHTHLLAMCALFVVSGACFALCARPSLRAKRFLIAEPFVATLVSFGCIWAMRFVDPRFAWLLFLSSGSAALVFAYQTFTTLRELREAETAGGE